MLPSITLQQIQVFLAVVDSGGFAKAAPTLSMSQSAVSKAVAKLETELNLTLFQRTTRLLELTEAGKQLYDLWLIHLNELETTLDHLQLKETAKQCSIGIAAASTTVTDKYLWNFVDAFAAVHPEIELNIESDEMTMITNKLFNGEYDVIFVPDFEHYELDAAGFPWKWAAKDNSQIILPKSSPLAGRKKVKISDIAGETFVIIDDKMTPGYYRNLIEQFAKAGLTPNIGKRYKSVYSLRNVHRAAEGLLFTDNYMDYHLSADAVKIPVIDCENGIICSWSKTPRNSNVTKFIEFVSL